YQNLLDHPSRRRSRGPQDEGWSWTQPWKRLRSVLAVEAQPQLLARLEDGDEFLLDLHRVARAGIAADAGRAALAREGAEAAQLHPVAPRQRFHDLVQDSRDDVLDVALIEVGVAVGDPLNEFGLNHRWSITICINITFQRQAARAPR